MGSQRKLKGIIPIMQTPFTADGKEVEYDDFARMCDVTVKDGSSGIALFGYGTEFYKLSDEERDRMVKVAVEAVGGRVPVIASITAGATEVAVKTAKRYEELGTDAVMVLSPSVVSPSTNALANHILAVINSVNQLSVIQYTPGSGGGHLSAEAFKRICDESKNELYVKAEAIPVAPFVDSIQSATGGKIGIFAGNMCIHMIDLMDRGVIGFMPAVSLVPIFNAIFNAYMNNDRVRAQQIYDATVPMVLIINQDIETLVKYEKMMMVKRGIIRNSYCRKPTAIREDERCWNMFDEYRERLRALVNVGEDYIA